MNNKLSVSLASLILCSGISLIASERRMPNPDQVRKNLFSVAATQGIYAPTRENVGVVTPDLSMLNSTQTRIAIVNGRVVVSPDVFEETLRQDQQYEETRRANRSRLNRLQRQLAGRAEKPPCSANLFQDDDTLK